MDLTFSTENHTSRVEGREVDFGTHGIVLAGRALRDSPSAMADCSFHHLPEHGLRTAYHRITLHLSVRPASVKQPED